MTSQSKNKKEEEFTETQRLAIGAITEVIKEQGWSVAAIGNIRIEQRDPLKKLKFEFVVDFVGAKKNG